MLNNLSGIAGVQETLEQTNELLAQVLAELKKVNAEGLPAVVDELRTRD